MIGSARAEEANAEYQKACPSGRPFNNTILWREARSTPEKVDFSSWQMRSNDADGKAGSGISVYSMFRTRYVSQGQVINLDLGFTGVSKPALAYIYPLDHAKLAESSKHGIYIRLASKDINLSSVQILVPAKGGGVAILTCQNGHSSIFSLNLPGREFNLQPNAGSVSTDAQGRPIIRMQAE